jgi:glucose-6-phosphate isomerase
MCQKRLTFDTYLKTQEKIGFMKNLKIFDPQVSFDMKTGDLDSDKKVSSKKELKELAGVFKDENTRLNMDQKLIIYDVDCYFPVPEGKNGGLFWGVTRINPGKVGNEYFMTRGHFHANVDTAEFYWGIKGQGVLIFMDKDGNTWGEYMKPNSLHYIPGNVAHRVANTGDTPLVFGACWPSDAGHNYEAISQNGFTARLMEENGKPTLIKD